jgi:hypothetical protein
MNKEELLKKFERNVAYLERTVPPDDIYLFAEQTFMAAMFFMHKWTKLIDVEEEAKNDPIARKWMSNIMGLVISREKDEEIQLDLDLKSVEE